MTRTHPAHHRRGAAGVQQSAEARRPDRHGRRDLRRAAWRWVSRAHSCRTSSPASASRWTRAAPGSTKAWSRFAACWRRSRSPRKGRFHSFEKVTSLPRPTQKPRPPFWIAALSTENSFENAGGSAITSWAFRSPARRWRDCMKIYRDAWNAAGHPGRGRVMLAFHMYCAETRAKAAAIAREPLNMYLRSIVNAASDWMSGVASRDYPNYQKMIEIISKETFESQVEKGCGLDRHAGRYPQRDRGLRSRGRRLRIRLAAGEFRYDRPGRGRAVDGAVRPRGDAALCALIRNRRRDLGELPLPTEVGSIRLRPALKGRTRVNSSSGGRGSRSSPPLGLRAT